MKISLLQFLLIIGGTFSLSGFNEGILAMSYALPRHLSLNPKLTENLEDIQNSAKLLQ
jgi:hypothetical protein